MLFVELIFLLEKEDNTDYPVIFCCISHVKLHQQVALTALYRQVNAIVRVPIVTGSEGKRPELDISGKDYLLFW